jgi:hypothetical protein
VTRTAAAGIATILAGVAIAIVRFLVLTMSRSTDASPTEAMLKDPWFLLDVAGAVGVMLYVIYA